MFIEIQYKIFNKMNYLGRLALPYPTKFLNVLRYQQKKHNGRSNAPPPPAGCVCVRKLLNWRKTHSGRR